MKMKVWKIKFKKMIKVWKVKVLKIKLKKNGVLKNYLKIKISKIKFLASKVEEK